ncbi:MAG: hypothetical protein N4A72_18610 [Bacteroidales bacterium]|jgi:biopolymer transport protein ExbD|nr:hypothetical protein [Bacteroidales bacterium]
MKINLLLVLFFVTVCNVLCEDRIKVNIPTVDSEADYVWRTIIDIDFFEKNRYSVGLPKGDIIEQLKEKSRKKKLTDKDYSDLKRFMKDSIYNADDYKMGYKAVADRVDMLNRMIDKLFNGKYNWNFKRFDIYNINLTLYGPGGSYNPDKGEVLIYTTTKGGFKQYLNPVYTIIHEIVHIGIQESLINRYKVPHAMKERIVDNIVMLYFGNDLPGYRIQNMGDMRIDKYLKSTGDIKKLNDNITKALKE